MSVKDKFAQRYYLVTDMPPQKVIASLIANGGKLEDAETVSVKSWLTGKKPTFEQKADLVPDDCRTVDDIVDYDLKLDEIVTPIEFKVSRVDAPVHGDITFEQVYQSLRGGPFSDDSFRADYLDNARTVVQVTAYPGFVGSGVFRGSEKDQILSALSNVAFVANRYHCFTNDALERDGKTEYFATMYSVELPMHTRKQMSSAEQEAEAEGLKQLNEIVSRNQRYNYVSLHYIGEGTAYQSLTKLRAELDELIKDILPGVKIFDVNRMCNYELGRKLMKDDPSLSSDRALTLATTYNIGFETDEMSAKFYRAVNASASLPFSATLPTGPVGLARLAKIDVI
ncbi:MAG: hypothetical protein KJ601_06720 [Nanoarchaeota archaeon]|nr:hypothetical protein [Nanoarchaeota archaeon]MBU1704609.1 hypothetical protein [Nanoarchaeota archaeon]